MSSANPYESPLATESAPNGGRRPLPRFVRVVAILDLLFVVAMIAGLGYGMHLNERLRVDAPELYVAWTWSPGRVMLWCGFALAAAADLALLQRRGIAIVLGFLSLMPVLYGFGAVFWRTATFGADIPVAVFLPARVIWFAIYLVMLHSYREWLSGVAGSVSDRQEDEDDDKEEEEDDEAEDYGEGEEYHDDEEEERP